MIDEVQASQASSWSELLFSFHGRISQRTFVSRVLFVQVCGLVFVVTALCILFVTGPTVRDALGRGAWFVLLTIILVAFFVPTIWIGAATTIKRLHDRNKSGWLALLLLIPLVNFWIAFEPYLVRGTAAANAYGSRVGTEFKRRAVLIAAGLTAILFVNFGLSGLFKALVAQAFDIPSGSNEPTILVGDYLFVSKAAYGYSRYSFPFGAVPFSGRFMASEPMRGDIVVFKFPGDNSTDYIKRLIGLPSDRIQMKEGVLYVNDKAIPKVPVADYIEDFGGRPHHVPQFRETLPNGAGKNRRTETSFRGCEDDAM
jgi:signal peptidase I